MEFICADEKKAWFKSRRLSSFRHVANAMRHPRHNRTALSEYQRLNKDGAAKYVKTVEFMNICQEAILDSL